MPAPIGSDCCLGNGAIVLAVAGNSVTFVASNVVALANARPDDQSLVGGLFNTAMQVGGVVGLAIMTAVAAALTEHQTSGDALLTGYQAAFWIAAGIALIGFVVAVIAVHPERP